MRMSGLSAINAPQEKEMEVKPDKKSKHIHCWHGISTTVRVKEPYCNPTEHWLEMCCECQEIQREIDFL